MVSDQRDMVNVDARQILEEDADEHLRCVNRVHLDSSNGLLAILPDLLVQLVPVLVPIVAGLGPHKVPLACAA